MKRIAWLHLLFCLAPFWAAEAAFVLYPKMFYFRSWEYFEDLAYNSYDIEPIWRRFEYGDATRENFFLHQEGRETVVTTDPEGFRSVPFRADFYPIVVGGDSNVFGTALSDSQTLPWKLAERLRAPVFNAGRIRLQLALKKRSLSRPGLVIDCFSEHFLEKDVSFRFLGRAVYFLREPRMSAWEALRAVPKERRELHYLLRRWLLAFSNDWKELHRAGFDPRRLRETALAPARKTPADLEHWVGEIVQRNRWMARRGFRYLFVPIPSKNTIVPADVDETTKNFSAALVARLRREGVLALELNTAFRLHKDEQPLYFRFDSHWNEAGVELACGEIADYIRKSEFLASPRAASK